MLDGHQHGVFELITDVIMPLDDEDSEYYYVYPYDAAHSVIHLFIRLNGEDDFFVEASAGDDGEVLLTSNRPGSFDLSIGSNLSEPEKEGYITIELISEANSLDLT